MCLASNEKIAKKVEQAVINSCSSFGLCGQPLVKSVEKPNVVAITPQKQKVSQ